MLGAALTCYVRPQQVARAIEGFLPHLAPIPPEKKLPKSRRALRKGSRSLEREEGGFQAPRPSACTSSLRGCWGQG